MCGARENDVLFDVGDETSRAKCTTEYVAREWDELESTRDEKVLSIRRESRLRPTDDSCSFHRVNVLYNDT